MARQPDIQYVRFYTAGSAARKLEPVKKPRKNGVALPKMKPRVEKRRVIRIDPLAVCAVVTAVFMLFAMAVGMLELGSLTDQANQMESYAAKLSAENAQLEAQYHSSYDLSDVEQKALDMGFVSEDQLQHITVEVSEPVVEAEPTAWEEFCQFVTELFA
ncbi:MAG: hypothetical protein IJB11_02345 [Oscillospiraceae bacterium]|nr:hypothetical protein [Oscillospiraceae bacterium]